MVSSYFRVFPVIFTIGLLFPINLQSGAKIPYSFARKGSLELCTYFLYRSSHQRCSVKNDVLKNIANFTGKHLCWRILSVKSPAFKT